MSADRLLSRLERVRQVAPRRWIASCPAHEDRSPSMSIRELDDGRLLLHDHGGCDAQSVLDAVGLSMADLFPERLHHGRPERPNHWHASREALRVLHAECLIVAIAAENIAGGVALTDNDRELLVQTAGRIRHAAEVCT